MDDLISRQAAIDAIMGEPTDAHYPSWYAERLEQLPSVQLDTYWKEQCQSYEQTINKLIESLSTQPEIVRCKDCKFASGDSRICMKFGHSPIGELDFCAWAERRSDGNL